MTYLQLIQTGLAAFKYGCQAPFSSLNTDVLKPVLITVVSIDLLI
jgi:hypothetical protein